VVAEAEAETQNAMAGVKVEEITSEGGYTTHYRVSIPAALVMQLSAREFRAEIVAIVGELARAEARRYFDEHQDWIREHLNVQQLRRALADAFKAEVDKLLLP